jgi:phosphoribosylanthranilate isomerase
MGAGEPLPARKPLQVKICGVCSAPDAALAGRAGASYVGVILAPGFTRTVSVGEAGSILAAGDTGRAGVFVDAGVGEVLQVAAALALDVIQLHGAEAPEVAAELRAAGTVRIWKAVRVRSPVDVHRAIERYADLVHGLLLDGWSAAGHGGTGTAFDWAAAAAPLAALPSGVELIVAGGLAPGNVGAAVAALHPDTVDVSSGVEQAVRRKSGRLVEEFMRAAQHAAEGGR